MRGSSGYIMLASIRKHCSNSRVKNYLGLLRSYALKGKRGGDEAKDFMYVLKDEFPRFYR